MNIIVDRKNSVIKWNYNTKEIVVQNFNVMYAFEYGDSMVMLKIKKQDGKIGFVLYDVNGDFILSYVAQSGEIITTNNKCIHIDSLISVEYSKKDKKIVALINSKVDGKKLVILNSDGTTLSDISSPLGYKYYYTKNMGNYIVVVCQGVSNLTADKYGRNDWNFRVDLDKYYVERISITQ